jgi:hypothetical protein
LAAGSDSDRMAGGHSRARSSRVAAVTEQAARPLLEEVAAAREETARYRRAVGDLRRVPDTLGDA